jgi:hypothetical protein
VRRGQRWLTARQSAGTFSRGTSMGHGAMAWQGVGSGNGPRERDDVEAEAHRRSGGAAALRRGRWGSSGSGSSFKLWWCPGTYAQGGKRGDLSCPWRPLLKKQRQQRQTPRSGQEVDGVDEMQGKGVLL